MIVAMMVSGVMMAGVRTNLLEKINEAEDYKERLGQLLVIGGLSAGYTVTGFNTRQDSAATWEDYRLVSSYRCRPTEQLREAQAVVNNPVTCDRMLREWQYWNWVAADCRDTLSDLEVNSGGI